MPDDELREKSTAAWTRLVEYYRRFPADIAQKRDGELHYDWAKHERKLRECLADVMSILVNRLRTGSGVSIGCGIVHVNSPLARRRLKLAVWGHTRGNHKRVWEKHVTRSNSRSLMFRQPSVPTHLLTELMWRLQRRADTGKGFALALFLTDQDPLYATLGESSIALACSSLPLAFFQDVNSTWRNKKADKTAFDQLGLDTPGVLESKILRPLNQRLYEVGRDAAVPLERQYSIAEVTALTTPAVDALLAMGKVRFSPDEVPMNIFYLPDVIETDEVGGVDFQILLDSAHVPDATMMHHFLRDAQWLFSQYVIHPLIAAERNHALAGRTYRDSHFSRTDNVADDGLDNLVERLKEAGNSAGDEAARKTVDIVLRHFLVARGSTGDYWRGYQRHAFETACTVSAVIDMLFPELEAFAGDGARSNHEAIVRSCGSNFEGLRKADVSEMVRQLFRGLAAENELFLTPFYREHFVHSFHCFALGLVLLAWRNVTVLPSSLTTRFTTNGESVRLLKEWFLVSMWHDVAYSLQKGHELLEGFVTDFMDVNKRGKRCRGLIPWRPSLGHLLQAKKMLDPLRAVACSAFHVSRTLKVDLGVGADDIALASALDRADHGIWSALFFGHVCKSQWLFRKHGVRVKDIMRAILVHHLPDWGMKSVLSDFDLDESMLRESTGVKDLTVSRFQDQIGKGEGDHVCVYRNENPLGFLLFLSDMLSQPGREAPEMGGRPPSRIGIRLDGLRPGAAGEANEDGALIIRLRYEDFPVSEDDLRNKFFGNLAKFFKLDCNALAKRAMANHLCVQLLKGEETDSTIWICFGGGKTRSDQ